MFNKNDLARTNLPGGTEIFCTNARDAALLWNEVALYFRAGFIPQPGDIVFDAGANVGLFSLQCWQKSAGKARIFSFEPIPTTFAVLEANARRFGSGGEWRTIRAALGEAFGEAHFSHFTRISGLSSRYPQLMETQALASLEAIFHDSKLTPRAGLWRASPSWWQKTYLRLLARVILQRETVKVPVWTVSAALQRFNLERIDWLKIDVEGAEIDVLLGIEAADWPKIKRLVLEADSAQTSGKITDFLRKKGFGNIECAENQVLSGFGLQLIWASRD